MAHKTLIGGTAYEIGGGKALVDATTYEIDKGKALVDGTVYEVGFAPEEATVTISKDPYSSGANNQWTTVEIDGVTYQANANTTLIVPIGTTMVCKITPYSTSSSSKKTMVKVDDVVVAEASDKNGLTYEYTIMSNVSILMRVSTMMSDGQISIITS